MSIHCKLKLPLFPIVLILAVMNFSNLNAIQIANRKVVFLQETTDSTVLISGRIKDYITKENLAFVSIQVVNQKNFAISDIDGKFSLQVKRNELPLTLYFTYLGYKSKNILVESESNLLHVFLEANDILLQEITILPGENPANKIIGKTIKNKELNRPENLSSYAYTSYNKLYITSDINDNPDTLQNVDTTKENKIVNLLKKQHLFLTESVSEKKYFFPDNYAEKIIASKVSGFKASPFTLLATQLQSFSFYPEQLELLQLKYVNPIAEGTFKRYEFTMTDTLFQNGDSVFVISYQPKKNTRFRGLKGVLYINSINYAIQSVIAEPAEENSLLSLKIRQNYENIEGKQWFPVQLNTDWIYNTVNLEETSDMKSTNSKAPKMKVVSRSYIKEIKLNPELNKKEFSEIEIEKNLDADNKMENFWNVFRIDSLNEKEKKTYRIIDSIGKKEKFDAKIKSLEALFTGELPLGHFNLQLRHLFNFNYQEGYRFGLGICNNNKLSDWFKLSGYGAYGLWDKKWKYGSELNLFVNRKKDLVFTGSYSSDVLEAGGSEFLDQYQSLNNPDAYRNLFLWKLDYRWLIQSSISFRVLRYFKFHFFANHQNRQSSIGFLERTTSGNRVIKNFELNEIGMQMRFVFKEKFMETGKSRVSLGSNYPLFYFIVKQGLNTNWLGLQGDFSYTRAETKISYQYNFLTLGKLSVLLNASSIVGTTPYSLLFTGKGSQLINYSISCPNSFETMGVNEFINTSQVALFLNHNFGNLFPSSKKWNPQLEITHNMGIGQLKNPDSIEEFGFRSMEKGYFESGIRINRLVASSLSGIGLGIFYRYGPYAKTSAADNFALKLSISTTF